MLGTDIFLELDQEALVTYIHVKGIERLNLIELIGGQITFAQRGHPEINQDVIVWAVLGLALLDAVLLYFAIQLFQRETILTRWK